MSAMVLVGTNRWIEVGKSRLWIKPVGKNLLSVNRAVTSVQKNRQSRHIAILSGENAVKFRKIGIPKESRCLFQVAS